MWKGCVCVCHSGPWKCCVWHWCVLQCCMWQCCMRVCVGATVLCVWHCYVRLCMSDTVTCNNVVLLVCAAMLCERVCDNVVSVTLFNGYDWFKGTFTGKLPEFNGKIYEHLWFPVDDPLNQSISQCCLCVWQWLLVQVAVAGKVPHKFDPGDSFFK